MQRNLVFKRMTVLNTAFKDYLMKEREKISGRKQSVKTFSFLSKAILFYQQIDNHGQLILVFFVIHIYQVYQAFEKYQSRFARDQGATISSSVVSHACKKLRPFARR